MKSSLVLRLVALVALIAPYASVIAQEATLRSVLAGTSYPLEIKAAELTDDYRAFRMAKSGNTDYFTLYGPMLSVSMAAENPGMAKLLGFSDAYWTKGDVANVEGQRFLITYKLSVDMTKLMTQGRFGTVPEGAEKEFMSAPLRLSLIKVDSIQSIEPDPSLKPDDLRKAMAPPEKQTPIQTASAKTQTLSNMKQVATAMIMYISDSDDEYPYPQTTKTIRYITAPYMKNNDLWTTRNPNGGEFLFNMALGGVSATQLEYPAEMVMFYESKAWPDGTRVVAFADGHARVVDSATWKTLQKWLKRKYKTKSKPLPANYGVNWKPGSNWHP